MLQEIWILPTWFIFPPKGCLIVFSALRGCLAVFFALRDCLGQIFGLLGILLCFDSTHYPKFWTGFWLGNEENWNLCSS